MIIYMPRSVISNCLYIVTHKPRPRLRLDYFNIL